MILLVTSSAFIPLGLNRNQIAIAQQQQQQMLDFDPYGMDPGAIGKGLAGDLIVEELLGAE